MALQIRSWLADRTAAEPEAVQGLNRGLPKGVGWPHTLGASIIAILVLEAITGVALAMYYSPHPDAAYETVRYIDGLPAGRLIHGIHHYADSALMVLLGLHLLRTYVQAAYKAPRELVWLSGILVMTLAVGFGFTGYLLPWDQNAYWATLVRTSYAGSIPVLGTVFQEMLRGGPDVGALTLTRFYALHVMLLPFMVMLFLIPHVALAWRKGPTPPNTRVGETVPHASRFLEHQLFKDATVILIVFAVIFGLAVLSPVGLDFKANPTDSTYHAHPEWYFLWLFQFVKDVEQLSDKIPTWLPAVVIPGIGMTLIALAPWVDRSRERTLTRRPLMMVLLALGLLFIAGMTIRGAATAHENATPVNSLYGHSTKGDTLNDLDPAQVAAGKAAFNSAKPVPCSACHRAYSDYTSGGQVNLSGYGRKSLPSGIPGHPELEHMPYYERFVKYVRGEIRPANTRMPKYAVESLSQKDLDDIAAYLSQDSVKATVEHADPRAATTGKH